MLTTDELRKMSQGRLEDAEMLHGGRRHDGAKYLCGYSIELALKARICLTLNWPAFPESKADFEGLTSFRTHDLDVLLRLSGIEGEIKGKYLADWTVIREWGTNTRYGRIGTATASDTQKILDSAKVLLKAI